MDTERLLKLLRHPPFISILFSPSLSTLEGLAVCQSRRELKTVMVVEMILVFIAEMEIQSRILSKHTMI